MLPLTQMLPCDSHVQAAGRGREVIKCKDVHASHKVTLQASYLLNTGKDELVSP